VTTWGQGDVLVPPSDRDHVAEFAQRAPLALALERALECAIYAGRELPRPVLDIGCGDGCFADVLLGSAGRIDHGIDADEQEVSRARRRGTYRFLEVGRAEQIPLPDASIGTIMSNSTLEHIAALDAALAEIHRVLRPGGRLFITVPTDKFERYAFGHRLLSEIGAKRAAERFRSAYNTFWKHHHVGRPTEWADRLRQAGFDVDEVREYDPPLRCTVHDLLVPFAFIPFVIKKVTGRYFLIPRLRRILVEALRAALPPSGVTYVAAGTGGLVFLAARRNGMGTR
jgi:SAM-dependent methyltransferase